MKKLLTLLLTVGAMAAFAVSASAITCTIDQRPAATLLIPYFQVNMNPDGSKASGANSFDTLVTVVNASSANVLAHVVVWNNRSVAVLDFNIPLTGFDVYPMSMYDILSGNIPANLSTYYNTSQGPVAQEVCQSNISGITGKYLSGPLSGSDAVWSASTGWVRFIPSRTAASNDNTAGSQYGTPAFPPSFANQVQQELDGQTCPFNGAPPQAPLPVGSNGVASLTGYITVDMANYCTFSDPSSASYWNTDAAGWENDLWGDYIYISGSGVPTFGSPAIGLEAQSNDDGNGWNFSNQSLNGWNSATTNETQRTFYARYWETGSDNTNPGAIGGDGGSTLNGSNFTENRYLSRVGLGGIEGTGSTASGANGTFGDMREPLGVQYAVRYLNTASAGLSTYLRVWRASSGADITNNVQIGGADLEGPISSHGSYLCTAQEQAPGITIYDEDETPVKSAGCQVSPCPPQTSINIPLETQRIAMSSILSLQQNGWMYIDFDGGLAPSGNTAYSNTNLEQGWIGYDMQGQGAFVNAGIDGTQLDPNNCFPSLEIFNGSSANGDMTNLNEVAPSIPQLIGSGH